MSGFSILLKAVSEDAQFCGGNLFEPFCGIFRAYKWRRCDPRRTDSITTILTASCDICWVVLTLP